MVSRTLNFLWINLDMPAPPDPVDGSIRQPLPLKYIENVRNAAKAHPTTKVILWMDSQRLTKRQWSYMKHAIEGKRANIYLKDLRSIPEYNNEPLYNKGETDPNWRNCGQTSLIWRQVDAAKILVSLQGRAQHVFFADLDHSHLEVTSPTVKTMLKKHGLMIGSYSDLAVSVENQVWGFRRNRADFFRKYYETALEICHGGDNAWDNLVKKVNDELVEKEGIPLSEICFLIGDDGTSAEHPGHEWRGGDGEAEAPAVIEKGDVSKIFNQKARRTPRRAHTPSQSRTRKPSAKAKKRFPKMAKAA